MLPGAVATNLNKEPTGIFAVDSDTFARHSLAKLGYEPVSHGHWKHHMFVHYNNWRPSEWFVDKINEGR